MDLEDLEYVQSTLKLLGSKRNNRHTGNAFLELFDGDQETIDKIDPMIAEKMGFKNCYPCFRTDVFQKSRYESIKRSGRHCGKRNKILQRHPSSAALKRS